MILYVKVFRLAICQGNRVNANILETFSTEWIVQLFYDIC